MFKIHLEKLDYIMLVFLKLPLSNVVAITNNFFALYKLFLSYHSSYQSNLIHMYKHY